MGMNFTTWNDIVVPLAEDADILQHLYDMLDNDDQPEVHLGQFVSDHLWGIMYSIAIGRIHDPEVGFFVGDFLRAGRPCEWSERELDFLADVTEFLRHSEPKLITPVQAMQLMLPHFDPGEVDLHYMRDWRGWRIESGPAFDARFGRKVVLLVGDDPLYNKYV